MSDKMNTVKKEFNPINLLLKEYYNYYYKNNTRTIQEQYKNNTRTIQYYITT